MTNLYYKKKNERNELKNFSHILSESWKYKQIKVVLWFFDLYLSLRRCAHDKEVNYLLVFTLV